MEIASVEIQSKPDGLVFVDQFKDMMERPAILGGVMVADGTDAVIFVLPVDEVR